MDYMMVIGKLIASASNMLSMPTNTLLPKTDDIKIRDGLYCCGDFQLNGSINTAMKVELESVSKSKIHF